jgi:hypothetical protein
MQRALHAGVALVMEGAKFNRREVILAQFILKTSAQPDP